MLRINFWRKYQEHQSQLIISHLRIYFQISNTIMLIYKFCEIIQFVL